MQDIYVSTDIEADGPIPGPHSMLSLASAAYLRDKTLLGTFAANLETLPGATADPDTQRWWQQHPKAWRACRQNCRPAKEVMLDYLAWLDQLPGTPVFVAYPAGFDFTFVYWYLVRFTGQSPFRQSALDIKTYAMAVLKRPFSQLTKRSLPKRWRDGQPHTHVALDDALEQGTLFCNMLAEHTGGAADPEKR